MATNWTSQMVAFMTKCASEKKSAKLTADIMSKEFGIALTRNSILGRANRENIGFGGQSTYVKKMKERSDLVGDLMRKHLNGNVTGAQMVAIASEVGITVSKDTIRKKASRMGLMLKREPAFNFGTSYNKTHPRWQKIEIETVEKIVRATPATPSDHQPLPLMRLNKPELISQCRAIVQEGPGIERLFCAKPVNPGSSFSFCPECAVSLVVKPTNNSQRVYHRNWR